MRIVIIADSLGMPRNNVTIEKTWTSLFIKKYSPIHEIYTFFQRGLTTNDILSMKNDVLYLYQPNVIIIQVGIVDCARRGLPLWLSRTASKIPVISKLVRAFASRFHYLLTKLNKSYSVPRSQFEKNIKMITGECRNRNIQLIFVKIAQPGEYLVKKVFNIENDINIYNSIIEKEVQLNGKFLDPYYSRSSSEYILEDDGHHLNNFGHQLVFNALNSAFESKELNEN